MYTIDDFHFNLPEELIALYPAPERDASRLMVVSRKDDKVYHKKFTDLPEILKAGDLLIFNNTRVINARLFFSRITGGIVEFVLNSRIDRLNWTAISNRSRVLKQGEKLSSVVNPQITLEIREREGDTFHIHTPEELTEELLLEIGNLPLPPYLKREPESVDHKRYQTIYAQNPGAAAAPTAGLHFTEDILSKITKKGIDKAFITLHTGWGTFSPVRDFDISKHKMHKEYYSINHAESEKINRAIKAKRRIIAVGTTSLRTMESVYNNGIVPEGNGETDIFIFPPYEFRSIDALITNFHTPGSTLLMLVSAFGGFELIKKAYREAVEKGYRFFSYGDSMLIL